MITYQYCSCGRQIPEIFRWLAKKYHFCGISGVHVEVEVKREVEREVVDNGHPRDYFFPCGYGTIQWQLINLWKKYKEEDIFTPYRWIGGIMGTDKIVSKNGLWLNCMRYYISRAELEEWLPPTYILSSNRDRIEFMARFGSCKEPFKTLHESSNQASNKKFILKKNIQRKEGIRLHMADDFTDADWSKYHDNGYVVVQEFMENVALVRGRKVNLRIYMLVTARKGKICVYYHPWGKCLYTKRTYSPPLLDTIEENREELMENCITSYNWDNNMAAMDKLYEEMPHSWDDLVKYVGNAGNAAANAANVANVNKKIIKILKRLKRVIRTVCDTPNEWWRIMQFQLFGLDFIFDQEWNPHLLEMNKGPDMEYKCQKDVITKRRVYEDVYRTVGMIPSLEESLFVEL